MKTKCTIAVALLCLSLLAAGALVGPTATRAQDGQSQPPSTPPPPPTPPTPWKGDPTRPELTGADAPTPGAAALQPPGERARMEEAAKRADQVVRLAHDLNDQIAKTATAKDYRELGSIFERLALDLQATVLQLNAMRGAAAGDAARDEATSSLLDRTVHMLKDAERMHSTIARAAIQ